MVVGFDNPAADGGYISVAQAPGLGVDLDEDVIRHFGQTGESFFK